MNLDSLLNMREHKVMKDGVNHGIGLIFRANRMKFVRLKVTKGNFKSDYLLKNRSQIEFCVKLLKNQLDSYYSQLCHFVNFKF